MYLYNFDYSIIFIFFLICLILSFLMIFLARILSPRRLRAEKLSAYECGFIPFSEARSKFDVSFALIAVLFLVFDLEIIFLIPWVLNIMAIGIVGLAIIHAFLIILLLGFCLELIRNVLDWNNVFK